MSSIMNSIKMLLFMTVLTGCLYPLAVTGIGKVFFKKQVNGSIVYLNKNMVGSELIGQNFKSDIYFHGRPSVCTYNGTNSGASNKSVTSAEFNNYVLEKQDELVKKYGEKNIPQEMYLNSGSGLDPHITPEAAVMQIDRVAVARKLSLEEKNRVTKLVEEMTENRDFGLFGEKRVNVLKLNLSLDKVTKR